MIEIIPDLTQCRSKKKKKTKCTSMEKEDTAKRKRSTNNTNIKLKKISVDAIGVENLIMTVHQKNDIYRSPPLFHWPVEADELESGIEKSILLQKLNGSIGLEESEDDEVEEEREIESERQRQVTKVVTNTKHNLIIIDEDSRISNNQKMLHEAGEEESKEIDSPEDLNHEKSLIDLTVERNRNGQDNEFGMALRSKKRDECKEKNSNALIEKEENHTLTRKENNKEIKGQEKAKTKATAKGKKRMVKKKQELIPTELENPDSIIFQVLKDIPARLFSSQEKDILLRDAVPGCLIMGQEAAGSAVVISPVGHILTCAHCLEDEGIHAEKIFLFPNGDMVLARCLALDLDRDIALLIITHRMIVNRSTRKIRKYESCFIDPKKIREKSFDRSFPYVPILLPFQGQTSPNNASSSSTVCKMKNSILPNGDLQFPPKTRCVCVGQPGRDRHNFTLLSVSHGRYLGHKRWIDPNKAKKKKRKTNDDDKGKGNGNSLDQSTMVIDLNDDKENSDEENDRTFLQNNSDIGALIHNCWTYWGHSGGPLISLFESPSTTLSLLPQSHNLILNKKSNENSKNDNQSIAYISKSLLPMVGGLHSSWDDTNGNRHGVHIECIWGFFQELEIDIHSFYKQL